MFEWTTTIVMYALLAGGLGGLVRLSDYPKVKLNVANLGEIVYAVVSSIMLALLTTWGLMEQMGLDITTFIGFLVVVSTSVTGMAGIRALLENKVVKNILAGLAPTGTVIDTSQKEAAAPATKAASADEPEELTLEPNS